MLKKLIKYDLKYMTKNMIIFYILALFFSLLIRIFSLLNNTFIINLITKICLGCLSSMVFSIIINTILRSWVRFKENLYKDESYLTHTLPVSVKTLYDSKLILTIIYSIISFVVILICLFVAFYSKDNYNLLVSYINDLSNVLNYNVLSFIILVIVLLFIEMFNVIQVGFLGIIYGNKKNDYKVLYSFIYGFISYLITQLLVIILIYILGLFNSNIMSIFIGNDVSFNVIKLLLIICIIMYLLISYLIRIICIKLLNTGVDID